MRPLHEYFHTAVWTGSEMIVWGGLDEIAFTSTLAEGMIQARTVGQPPALPMRPLPELSHGSMDRQRNDRLGWSR